MTKRKTEVPPEIRKKIYDNSPENVAKAAKRGMTIYEGSFTDERGRYSSDLEVCMILACEHHSVDPRFARILYLASHSWWNDMVEWVAKRGA